MKSVTLWYDSACPLCLREIAMMRRLDWRKRIVFIDLMDNTLTCPLDRDVMLARIHACEDGRIISGAAAFAAMWRVIPILRPFGLLARNATMLRTLEMFYIQFLKVRPHIQRLFGSRS